MMVRVVILRSDRLVEKINNEDMKRMAQNYPICIVM